ncbi:MAG: TlpA disulfide reductase family protein [Alphaproteobacteria bacterium]|jgi:thiol-disulfide isomerase/thioredoxin|nr:TlpA disulfide reductase family protein [Alphaproteobacteria bacterium]MDP6588932.1 TlpA disulfide reductase family protein [Alphaproteobacteria bacterium]MDP6818158.1 TlpA disulfide reductase family protein [Alphaproteobacteria bacterium]|tara:strand:- start:733 stop:1236 length:504 start_codon:yes stop_codon:yes gene_type:complete
MALLLFSAPYAAMAEEKAVLKLGAPAPDFAFTSRDGSAHKLSQFRGKPVMLWFFASWCPTCISSTGTVSQRFEQLTAGGMQIIQLRLYNNLGYSGPSAEEFAQAYAGAPGESQQWLWGEASLEASVMYDPRGYPDLYFLIDRDGVLRGANGAPNASMNDILEFAGES